MNTCESYAALLDAFAEGDLFTEDMIRVQQHLNTCPACQAYLEDLLTIRAAFPTVEDTDVPDGFAESVMAAVAAHPRTAAAPVPQKKKTPWVKILAPLAACCAIVVLLQGGPFGGRKEEAVSISYSAAPSAAMVTADDAAEAAPVTEEGIVMEPKAEAPQGESAGGAAPEQEPAAAAPKSKNLPSQMAETVHEPTYLNDTVVFRHVMELPAEAAELLSGHEPVQETEDAWHYHISQADYTELQTRLADAGIAYMAEAGIDPDTDLVLVIISK